MSNLLSEIEIQKIKGLLLRRQAIIGEHLALVEATTWSAEKLSEMTLVLLNEPISEELTIMLADWSQFLLSLSMKRVAQTQVVPSEKDIQFSIVSGFAFGMQGSRRPIPFKYWGDLAPLMLEMVRNFYFGPTQTSDQWLLSIGEKIKPISKRQNEIAFDPKTMPLFKEWQSATSDFAN